MKIIKGIVIFLLVLALGSIAASALDLIPSRSTDSSLSSSSENDSIRLFYTSLNFEDLTINTNVLTKEVMLNILNEKRDIFESVDELQYVYRDEGSLKFGNSTTAGMFKVTLKDGYEISHIAVTGRAYSRLTVSNETWSCDKSAMTVYMQDSSPDFYAWPNNDKDNSKRPESTTFTFTTLRSNYFQINGAASTTTNKTYRFDIYKIEFWLGQAAPSE